MSSEHTCQEKASGALIHGHARARTEGSTEYTTCANLLQTSSSTWPQTAVFQIIASGVPAEKVVIGKPATTGDANNGYVAPSTLAGCVAQAKNQGWSESISRCVFPMAVDA